MYTCYADAVLFIPEKFIMLLAYTLCIGNRRKLQQPLLKRDYNLLKSAYQLFE